MCILHSHFPHEASKSPDPVLSVTVFTPNLCAFTASYRLLIILAQCMTYALVLACVRVILCTADGTVRAQISKAKAFSVTH